MHQQIDKKHKYILLFLLFFLLTTISNVKFSENLNNLSNIKDLKVVGLSNDLNQKIKERINFLLNQNIFFINENFLKENLNELKYLESFDVFKVFPSKIIINLKKTDYLANTIKNNQKYIVGSNGKFIEHKTVNSNLDLPNIFGNFSKKEFIIFFKKIKESKLNYSEIKDNEGKYYRLIDMEAPYEDVNLSHLLNPVVEFVSSGINSGTFEEEDIEKGLQAVTDWISLAMNQKKDLMN